MAEQPPVSVIIPAYNAEKYIGQAIGSALAQTYRNIEVIVVDDGSTDGTAEIVKGYSPPVRYVRRDNGGPAAARNTALQQAVGTYVAFLDADDIWRPEKLGLQVPFMENRPSAGMSGADVVTFRNAEPFEWPPIPTSPSVRSCSYQSVVFENGFLASTVIARRSAVERAGGFDETIYAAEDRDLWSRITARWEGFNISAAVTAHREWGGSVSSNRLLMIDCRLKVLRKAFRDAPGLPFSGKRRALSEAHYDAIAPHLSVSRRAAAASLAKSLFWWPLPLGPGLCTRRLARLKFGVRLLLEPVGLRCLVKPRAVATDGASVEKAQR